MAFIVTELSLLLEGPHSSNVSTPIAFLFISLHHHDWLFHSLLFWLECCSSRHGGYHYLVDGMKPQVAEQSCVNICFPGVSGAPRCTWAWVTHHQTRTSKTQPQTRGTYRASVRRWSCRIPRGRTPILWRSWRSRPPCAGSPTHAKTARQRGGQGSDENHLTQCVSSSSCDESPWVPLVVAELI